MKKIVAILIFSVFILCGCSKTTSGNSGELTKYNWSAKTEGGGEAELSFSGNSAVLSLSNGGKTSEIKGRFLADDSTLVIFDPRLGQNYGFDYVPKGEILELFYEGSKLEFEAKE